MRAGSDRYGGDLVFALDLAIVFAFILAIVFALDFAIVCALIVYW